MFSGHGAPFLVVGGQVLLQHGEDGLPFLVVTGLGLRHGAGLLELHALVDEQGGVAAVVEDHVGALAVGPGQGLLGAPPVFLDGLALPGIDRDAGGGDGGGGVVLGGVDVAGGPAHLGAELDQGLDQHRGLDGHVQAAGDARALEGLGGTEFLAQGHQAGHLAFGDGDFLAAPVGQGQVGNFIVVGVFHDSVHTYTSL
jgi:hypothetical protein